MIKTIQIVSAEYVVAVESQLYLEMIFVMGVVVKYQCSKDWKGDFLIQREMNLGNGNRDRNLPLS